MNAKAPAPWDEALMSSALAVGRHNLGRTWPNPAVGAVVARETPSGPVVLARGSTAAGGRPHAETQALSAAGEGARGATLYVTLEPCSHHGHTPPCVDAICAAGISRVVAALQDPDARVAGRGFTLLRAAGVEVSVGAGAQEARLVHAGHLRRVGNGRPHILLKLAISADGKAGLAGRRPAVITGPQARDRVHMMRATSDAVLTGIGTVLSDDPLLTCRLPGMEGRSPVRVVLDSTLRLPHTSALANSLASAPLWVISGPNAPAGREAALRALGIDVMRVDVAPGGLDLGEAARRLAGRGITRLMVESGPRLASAFLAADLVDEAALFTSDVTLGADALDALDDPALSALNRHLSESETETCGPDRLRILRRREPCSPA